MATKQIQTILFCGLGAIGQRHLRIVKSLLPKAKIFAYRRRGRKQIVNDDLTARSGSPERFYGLTHVYDWQTAVRLKPDLVFVTNPSALHVPTAQKFLRAGTHLIIEKPLGVSVREAEKFYRQAARTKNAFLVGYQLNHHPLFVEVKKLLRRKAIGRLCSVHVAIGYYAPIFHRYESYRDSYLARRDQGGGVILTQSHEINSIVELFGLPKSLYALGGKRSRLAINVADTAAVLCDYRSFSLTLHMDYLQYQGERTYRLVGDKGTIILDLVANTLTTVSTAGKIKTRSLPGFERNSMFRAEQKDILKQIRTKKYDRTNLQNAVLVLKFSEAIKKSIRLKRIIS